MRMVGVGMILALCACRSHAGDADDARKMRRLLAAGYWPKEMTLSLGQHGAHGDGAKDAEVPRELGKTSIAGGEVKRQAASGAASSGTGSAKPAAAPAPRVTEAQARAAIQRLDKLIAENQKSALELDRAGVDFLGMVAGRRKRARTSLRPLLLYLVEKGIIEEAEVDRFLEAEDATELMARVYTRLSSLGARRTMLEMERLFLAEQLPKNR